MNFSQKRKNRPFREAGYTLFEIMLVLGIISVLVGSAIYMLAGNIDVAKEQRVGSDIEAISMQLRTYEMLNYRMPSTEQGLKALVTQPAPLEAVDEGSAARSLGQRICLSQPRQGRQRLRNLLARAGWQGER
jgi:prepilin-type N-terminal cleavage/methylation domain-containing protein